ncbi:chemotaxis protein MotB [Amaricoccus macauensis]|uniref:Chemotaxis protein MotB n=1 Tax=Amaricoccus macauensis TaxID=57001 RepID=A0A840SG89_9RHOB|nr:flagellar motor protein MotB [Amaricoccus macauensis]MBB5220877.1 chemotaxis protein MotB [Amaricoccus macauensis]
MEKGGNVVIVKRRSVIAGRHHGGAWKVAYADFVTAMMAFFLLMWLLSTTDEKTRLGLADYFSPTIPISQSRSGGDGPFQGDSMLSQDVLARDETGQKSDPSKATRAGAEADGSDVSLFDVEKALLGGSGDAMKADPMLEHIRTRVTDEGLIIEVFDTAGSPLFDDDTVKPTPIFGELVAMIGRVLAHTANPVAITGNLALGDTGRGGPDPWHLSADRAQLARGRLVEAGVSDDRLARVTGKADRSPVTDNPRDSRNRRIEITLLRHFPD